MTKTLTEQWRNGTLGGRWYYIKVLGKIEIARLSKYNQFYHLPITNGYAANKDVSEVLAPVPTYDQFVELTEKVDQFSQLVKKVEQLEKKLDIATKALKRIYKPAVGDIYNFETDELDHGKLQDIAYKALKEIDLVRTSMSLAKDV